MSEFVNKKKINKFKKILTDKEKYKENIIITLNNEKNMLEIYDLDKKEYIFTSNFDTSICFFDLEKDIKNNIKSEKIKKNIKKEKYILIAQKENPQSFNNSFIFKLSKDIFTRFEKSISSKGNKMQKRELFSSSAEEKEEKDVNEQEGKINLEDILSLRQEEEKNQSDSENKDKDSEKPNNTRNEKNIKFEGRNFSRSMTFRKSSSGNEKSDNEEKEKVQKTDSSMEIKEKEGKDEESEEDDDDENKEESDKDDDKDENNSSEDNKNIIKHRFGKENNPINKINDKSKKQKSNDVQNSFDDNINNKLSEEKDDDNNKSEGSLSPKNNNKKINNQNNLEEINTDMNDAMNNINTIESESKSSKNE